MKTRLDTFQAIRYFPAPSNTNQCPHHGCPMASLANWKSTIVPAGILFAVLAIFMQIPPGMLDFLLAGNLALATVILLTTFYVKTPLELSVFPTILLAATLGRLALNIASTRLILLGGESLGADAGGQVIRSFGEFVAGNQLIVGLLIFVILVVVQFLVITSGAARISEVAARFSLDGMPGRQSAVDGDLGAGLITEQQARERRLDVVAEADFYGAMDGASKFVRGDAMAGLVIMVVNLCGGMVVGLGAGMGVGEAANTFCKLTIGDGLISQIPALLISLASGVLISRASRPVALPNDMLKQLTARPEALAAAAVFLIALITARLPVVPMLTLGAACGGLAWLAYRDEQQEQTQQAQGDAANPPPAKEARPDRHSQWLQVDPLVLELGTNLLKLASPERQDSLLARLAYLRELMAAELGIVLPQVRIRDNTRLDRNAYRISMSGSHVAQGRLRPAMKLATVHGEFDVVGEETLDPVTGEVAWWIPPSTEAELRQQGCDIRSPLDVLLDHFQVVVRLHAAELLSRDAVQQLIASLEATSPAAVEELKQGQFRLGDLQATLQRLLAEGISIRPLGRILEAVSDAAAKQLNGDERHQLIRSHLGRLLVSPLCDETGRLHAVLMSDAWLDDIELSLSQPAEDPDWLPSLRQAVAFKPGEPRVAVLAPDGAAPLVRTWIAKRMPGAPVMALHELPPDLPLALTQCDTTESLLERAA